MSMKGEETKRVTVTLPGWLYRLAVVEAERSGKPVAREIKEMVADGYRARRDRRAAEGK